MKKEKKEKKEKRKISKKEIEVLSEELAKLQRIAKALKIATVVVVEGWGASGKGALINNLILPLDPRGFCVYTIKDESEEEMRHPFLWRFMTKTPKKGEIAVFDRSWYRRVLNEHIDKKVDAKRFDGDIEEINNFEKMLTDDGVLMVKYFLHITKDEQKKRLEKLMSKIETRWRVTEDDLLHNKQYEKYLEVSEKMICKTDKASAKWKMIDANDTDVASLEMMQYFKDALSAKIEEVKAMAKPEKPQISEETASKYLENVDLSLDISKKDYKESLKYYQDKLFDLQNVFYLNKIPVVIVFEGWDAAGKGGAIKRLTSCLDPRGYRVVSTPAPTPDELAHHYLWRFWNNIPKTGHTAIFDRSWYGRVMVEPIEGFCTDEEYKRAFTEINHMEKHLVNSGMVVIKFFIHISKDEQLVRFEDRKNNPLKAWKLTDEDYRNREKWDIYTNAIEAMFENTSTKYAPWYIISGNSKKYARIEVLKTVTEIMEKRLEADKK